MTDAEEVLVELDPQPAVEALPVSRRATLQALASVGALSTVGSAQGQDAAGGVVAEEAYFSNYGWEPDSDGGTLTIDGDEYVFDGSEEIELPDGSTATEVVTPSGAVPSELIGPGGEVLWEAPAAESGELLYVIGSDSSAVQEYYLSAAFDVSTASYDTSFDVSAEEDSPNGLVWNDDGSKLYIVGTDSVEVQEYDVSTAFDVSTASHATSFDVRDEDEIPRDLSWNDDGSKFYIVGTESGEVQEYDVSTAFDVSTASHATSFDVSDEASTPAGFGWNDDGSKIYVTGYSTAEVYEYDLSAAFDVSTASYDTSFDVSAEEDSPNGLSWNDDGSKLYVIGYGSNEVQEYDVSTAFDVSTASHATSFDVSDEEGTTRGLAWNGAPQYEGFKR